MGIELLKREELAVGIVGAAGKMSRAVIRLLEQKNQDAREPHIFNIVAGIEPLVGNKYTQLGDFAAFSQKTTCEAPVMDSFTALQLPTKHSEQGKTTTTCAVEVAIDFSTPQSTLAHLSTGKECGVQAWVIGTTGFSEREEILLREYAHQHVIVRSGNFSKGIHALLPLLAEAAKLLGMDCDIEIVETHHKDKRDAPSGTAKLLARTVSEARGLAVNSPLVYGRSGEQALRKKNEIGIAAVRGGGVIGEHAVHFIEQDEQLILKHTAFNRVAFASGVPTAIRFAHAKKSKAEFGYYEMSDVMNYFKQASRVSS